MDLILACRYGEFNRAKELISSGIDINYQCINDSNLVDSTSALHVACFNNDIEYVKLLTKANPNLQTSKGYTPLMYNLIYNNPEIINQLLNMGADPDIQTYHGKTSIHYAAKYNSVDIMKFLLSTSQNIWLQDYKGRTALDLAKTRNHIDIITIIEEFEDFDTLKYPNY